MHYVSRAMHLCIILEFQRSPENFLSAPRSLRRVSKSYSNSSAKFKISLCLASAKLSTTTSDHAADRWKNTCLTLLQIPLPKKAFGRWFYPRSKSKNILSLSHSCGREAATIRFRTPKTYSINHQLFAEEWLT